MITSSLSPQLPRHEYRQEQKAGVFFGAHYRYRNSSNAGEAVRGEEIGVAKGTGVGIVRGIKPYM
jgi:hypothetical protein